jgi:hypothetical protein
MPLSVTEKQHWRDAIARRIDRRVESLRAAHPALFERLRREAHAEALDSLGLAEAYAELEAVREAEKALARHRTAAQRAMTAALRGVPIEEVPDSAPIRYGLDLPLPVEVHEALTRRQAAHEATRLAGDPVGRELARLETEKESLLDTVWLATSPGAIRQLWTKVAALLGEEPTPLEREALAIEPPAAG